MRVLVQIAQHCKVFAIAVVVIACDRGGVATGDVAGLLLPLPPVVVAVVALDLVGGGGRPPQKSFRKRARRQSRRRRWPACLFVEAGCTPSSSGSRRPSRAAASPPCRPLCDASHARAAAGRRAVSMLRSAGRHG